MDSNQFIISEDQIIGIAGEWLYELIASNQESLEGVDKNYLRESETPSAQYVRLTVEVGNHLEISDALREDDVNNGKEEVDEFINNVLASKQEEVVEDAYTRLANMQTAI